MTQIHLLDKGYVRLVDSMGSDMSIVRAARVSFDAEPRNDGSDDKLIRYLMQNRHTSPFESVSFTFEVKAPIFIFRQWHRHRTWSYNEMSARYTELPDEYYIPDLDIIGQQSKTNKQARVFEVSKEEAEERDNLRIYEEACEKAFETYKYLLTRAKWPRELARMVLPVSTYSKMFASVDLHNLFTFIKLRADSHAQYEIQLYANALYNLACFVTPIACNAFREMNPELLLTTPHNNAGRLAY